MQNVQAGLDESASSSRIESVKTEVLKTVAYTLLYGVNEPQKIDVQYDINFYGCARRDPQIRSAIRCHKT